MAIQFTDSTERTSAVTTTGMSEDLFDILVCPVDKDDLRLEGQSLVCITCGRTYLISDGIPDMLVDEQPSA
jgi:uncharacterized protein YbaR (Trm112 family)